MQGAGADEGGHGPRGRAGQGPRQEQRDRHEQDAPAAVQVGQAAVERHGDGAREQVDREDPGVERQAGQVPDDGRHRGGDDGPLEGGHGGHEQEGHEDGSAAARVEAGRLRFVHPDHDRT